MAEKESPFDPKKHLSDLGGKDYLEVKWRLAWLRDLHSDADIETEMVRDDPEQAVFKAKVSIPERGSATGYGSETKGDFRDFIEKAETKALGRALAALGFGTQFCDDFGEGGAVADTPVQRQARRPAPSKAPVVRDGPSHSAASAGEPQDMGRLRNLVKRALESGQADAQAQRELVHKIAPIATNDTTILWAKLDADQCEAILTELRGGGSSNGAAQSTSDGAGITAPQQKMIGALLGKLWPRDEQAQWLWMKEVAPDAVDATAVHLSGLTNAAAFRIITALKERT